MRTLLAILSILCFASCAPERETTPADHGGGAEPRPPDAPTVLFLGDSLTEGLGVLPEEAYPARIAARIAAEGLRFEVRNAGLSGDTTAGGLGRIDWLLEQVPAVLVLALGANDGLRGIDPAATERNLVALIDRARAAAGPRLPVLLCGMRMPPNLGAEYTAAFAGTYERVAASRPVTFLPFLLEGVAGDPSLNQADGIHPNAAGHEQVAAHVGEALLPILRELAAREDPAPRSESASGR